jgi:hypothetical protein
MTTTMTMARTTTMSTTTMGTAILLPVTTPSYLIMTHFSPLIIMKGTTPLLLI